MIDGALRRCCGCEDLDFVGLQRRTDFLGQAWAADSTRSIRSASSTRRALFFLFPLHQPSSSSAQRLRHGLSRRPSALARRPPHRRPIVDLPSSSIAAASIPPCAPRDAPLILPRLHLLDLHPHRSNRTLLCDAQRPPLKSARIREGGPSINCYSSSPPQARATHHSSPRRARADGQVFHLLGPRLSGRARDADFAA